MIHCVDANLHRAELTTRLPFRYGITTMTELPHVFLSTTWSFDEEEAHGLASEHLPPKWFTKDPDTPVADEIDTMLGVIRKAVSLSEDLSPATDVFAWWQQLQQAMTDWAAETQTPSLLTGLGTSLIERSLLDAYCRHLRTPLHRLIQQNTLRMDLGSLHPELQGTVPADWLPALPLERVTLRHTVGMEDPLSEADITDDLRLNDGLPQSLEACIAAYSLREFKLKLCGQPDQDEERLRAIFQLLDTHAPADWRFSLDGNENFATANDFRRWWTTVIQQAWMQGKPERLLFVEQPVHRGSALADTADWKDWAEAPPIIIDESGAEPTDLRRALDLGYHGVSHKNCKGVFHGIANACLLQKRAAEAPDQPWLMSDEDLANIGPVALLQDLAVQALLGNASVERNGHHYFRGLSTWPESWQQQTLAAHPDLYQETDGGLITLRIQQGELHLDTVHEAPFGLSPLLDL